MSFVSEFSRKKLVVLEVILVRNGLSIILHDGIFYWIDNEENEKGFESISEETKNVELQ